MRIAWPCSCLLPSLCALAAQGWLCFSSSSSDIRGARHVCTPSPPEEKWSGLKIGPTSNTMDLGAKRSKLRVRHPNARPSSKRGIWMSANGTSPASPAHDPAQRVGVDPRELLGCKGTSPSPRERAYRSGANVIRKRRWHFRLREHVPRHVSQEERK